uniref:Uncharacterized protein n=1 Tax=Globodera rostochiensis TaxID=31243 RepID=A0A914HVX6_GLORO
MVYNASADLWYQYFNASGPQIWILIILFGVRSIWATIGILFNISLIYVTCCSKSLHGICNVLIALESLFGTTMDATFYYCFPIIIVPGVVMGNCAQLAMVLTGLDRLIAVLFPLWYKTRKGQRYFLFVALMLVVYSIYQFAISYIAYQTISDIMMSCSTTEKTTGNLAALMNANGYTLSAILMTFYGLLCFLVFKLSATAKNFNNESKKLVKAMVFIIAFNLFGVFIKCFVQFLFQFVVVDVFFKNYYGIAFSFVTIAVYSANAPVLYVISSEYRARFNKHFKWLPSLFIQKQTQHVGISTIVLKPNNYSVRLRNAGGPNFAPSGDATARTIGRAQWTRTIRRTMNAHDWMRTIGRAQWTRTIRRTMNAHDWMLTIGRARWTRTIGRARLDAHDGRARWTRWRYFLT